MSERIELPSVTTSSSASSGANSPSVSTPATSTASEDTDAMAAEGEKMGPLDNPSAVPVDKMRARLEFLIKQSSIYASIIGEKMAKQQQVMKEKAEEEDQKRAKVQTQTAQPEDKTTKAPARKSGRTVAAVKEEEEPVKPTKKKRGKPAKAQPKGAVMSDYFSKVDLKSTTTTTAEALANVGGGEETKLGLQKDLRSARQPKLITGGVMKDYQLQGLDWLVSLYENGLNGILADEMGLGKTLQTISFMAFLREKGMNGPFLVAAPVSTLSNWVDEIERFAPEMPVLLYHGTPTEREHMRKTHMKKLGPEFPIICTSYELIMNDRKHLQRFSWKFIIIDEGHRIKNLNCKLIRELKSYSSANRLLLTGTPLQNNLSELWSLLNFLLPDIFDDLDSFQNWFDFSAIQEKEGHHAWLEEQKKTNLVGSLHAILKPFLLRRMKTDVETTLPPKREYVLYAPLTQGQKDLYGKLLKHEGRAWVIDKLVGGDATKKRKLLEDSADTPKSKKAKSTVAGRGARKNKKPTSYKELEDWEYFQKLDESSSEEEIEVLDEYQKKLLQATKEASGKKLQNLVMQLRQACNSPHLFYWPWADGQDPDNSIVTESGKMMLLERLVPALFERGHKVLIFSQFAKMLDIIEDWASDLRGWPVCRIDGGVSQVDRREQIRRFNKDEGWNLFLLSTRAGGLGINLTAADTVILFDSDWNPQQDLQAQDRAHRIGQKNPVIVYRFATAATVEQTLLEKADGKRRLEKLVIQKGKFKSIAAVPAAGNDHDELSKILLTEDFEKVNVVQAGQQVLSDSELETLMDRSKEAYEKAEKGGASASGAFRVVETQTGDIKEEGK